MKGTTSGPLKIVLSLWTPCCIHINMLSATGSTTPCVTKILSSPFVMIIIEEWMDGPEQSIRKGCEILKTCIVNKMLFLELNEIRIKNIQILPMALLPFAEA